MVQTPLVFHYLVPFIYILVHCHHSSHHMLYTHLPIFTYIRFHFNLELRRSYIIWWMCSFQKIMLEREDLRKNLQLRWLPQKALKHIHIGIIAMRGLRTTLKPCPSLIINAHLSMIIFLLAYRLNLFYTFIPY